MCYILTITETQYTRICKSLKEATDLALMHIEYRGWQHEQCFAKAPNGGKAWAQPNGKNAITIAPISDLEEFRIKIKAKIANLESFPARSGKPIHPESRAQLRTLKWVLKELEKDTNQ